MNPILLTLLAVAAQAIPPDGLLIIESEKVTPAPPLFFTASAEATTHLDATAVTTEIATTLRVLQGTPEILTLGLDGTGEVTSVSGPGLRDWSVRHADGHRYLDLRPTLADDQPTPESLAITITVRTSDPTIPSSLTLPTLAPGDAVGFSSTIRLVPGVAVDIRTTRADGLQPIGPPTAPHAEQHFSGTTSATLEVQLIPRGVALAPVDLIGPQLTGRYDPIARCVNFRLTGAALVRQPGASLPLLSGRAALSEAVPNENWHVELVDSSLALVFDQPGVFPVDLSFAAAVRDGDWKSLDFRLPAGTIVPLSIEGLPTPITFDPKAAVVPDATSHRGFLAADGHASLGWRQTRESGTDALSFTSNEQTDVRVGAGLLRQTARLDFRVLQGKLPSVRVALDGPGEILGVEGDNVVGWQVVPDGEARALEVRLSRPIERSASFVVRSQAPLGTFPVTAAPLRFTPDGGLRHSGTVRITNDGAVRLEVAATTGLLQLAPSQFPAPALDPTPRQVFVYRFPSASYAYEIVANQILPEVGVSQIVLYELTPTDRVITADLELDIREAPLREWSLTIPADYAVVDASGAAVADYIAETDATDERRVLKILFNSAVEGRQLIRLRLERNEPAAAGDWTLPPLSYPGARSVRGHLGVVTTPGFRIVPSLVENLTDLPLTLFPNQTPGLQQAYRQREADWSATLAVEALGRSIQSDVFHLYSLREGVVTASILFNYFVVGSPANEWRIAIPPTAGNIDVIGQNVRRDWRREGDEIVVALHQPVLGAATLLVTFEQPLSARGGTIRPGQVRPLGVQGERGFIQVVSPLQVKSNVETTDGPLLPLEPLELPSEFRLLSNAPSLAVYQYTARPFDLALAIEWYAPAGTVDQLVDFAKLSTRVSRDGQAVTDVRYFVKTRGRQSLRLVLPESVQLWEARADNAIVSAQVDGAATLIPLPPRLDPNEPVEVTLRLGQTADRPSSPTLTAPATASPTVISEWTITGDPGQLLVPRGGTAQLEGPVLTETGFQWLATRSAIPAFLILAAFSAAAFLLRRGSTPLTLLGFAIALGVLVAALGLGLRATQDRLPNRSTLTYSAAVIPAGEAPTVELGNVTDTRAMISPIGIATALAGLSLLGFAIIRRRSWIVPSATLLLTFGVLIQRGGAIPFFLLIATAVLAFLLLPTLFRWVRKPAAATSLLLFGVANLALAVEPPAAQSIVQTWSVQDGRLTGEIDVTVRGSIDDSFLLLRPPATLTKFEAPDGLRLTKVDRGDRTEYFVALDRDGTFTASATFELPVPDFTSGLPLVTGPAAIQRVTIRLAESGWEFASPAAVSIEPLPDLPDDTSGATLVLQPGLSPTIEVRPRTRDTAAEPTEFFVEADQLYVPAPGVVSGTSRFTIRPVQGQVSSLAILVPSTFTVSDVANGPVAAWRFNPTSRELHVDFAPAQTDTFTFDVETQLGTADLPVDLKLTPLRIPAAEGEVGMLALAFGGDAQPENVKGSTPVNLQDFPDELLPKSKDDQPLATLQHVFRTDSESGDVSLRVAPVAPEVRTVSRQVFSFGDDRLVLAADLTVSITRAGLFSLSFVLPDDLEVESISGPALSQWTQTDRLITLQLNGRTIGDQTFALTLVGPALSSQTAWPVPRLLLREATRQTGELVFVPEQGLRLRAVERENVSQLDSRAVGETRSGALAFRLLQENWSLTLGIETLDPWVTVQALQETTLREGQTLSRLALSYRIENAAVSALRLRLPGLTATQAATVRATGPAVNDLVQLPDSPDLWEIRFERGIVGTTEVQIEYQTQTNRDEGPASIDVPVFEDTRQVTQYAAVRGGGRIELAATTVPRGWQRTDWSAVPTELQDPTDRGIPALCYRVAEAEAPLTVRVERHDIADSLRLRVTKGDLTTLVSPLGPTLTAVRLDIEVIEKSSLRFQLPPAAELFSAFVNDQSVHVVRAGDAYLVSVSPNTEADRAATVRLVYSVPTTRSKLHLLGPNLDVPLVDVSWRIILPPGTDLAGYDGELRLENETSTSSFGLAKYQTLSSSSRTEEAQRATDWIDQANSLIEKGQQQQAGEALSKAANNFALDEATNEDARVQLKSLLTQQAVVGLNTRRQRLYLDNRTTDTVRNEQLEQAANANPFMQGGTTYDPQQMDQLLRGNTSEENAALRGIADRIVEQQLAAEPAPGAIDVTIPESGKIVTFTRSIQVDPTAALEIELELANKTSRHPAYAILILLVTAATATLATRKRP